MRVVRSPFILSLASAFLCVVLVGGAPAGAAITQTHRSLPVSSAAITRALAKAFGPTFAGRPFCAFAHQNVAVTSGLIRVSYPAGSSAPSAGTPYGGAQVCAPLTSGPRTDVTLSYRVRIPVGFQFVKGGKLPGLYGGSEPFSGGGHNRSGWSMRLMWRAAGAAEVYGYVATTTGDGDSWGRGDFRWKADGKWHTVAEHVHLNSPGRANGSVSVAYDQVPVISKNGLAITTTGTAITGLFFSTFYGGHDATWAPTSHQYLQFSDFAAH